jgi:hypothetical protein
MPFWRAGSGPQHLNAGLSTRKTCSNAGTPSAKRECNTACPLIIIGKSEGPALNPPRSRTPATSMVRTEGRWPLCQRSLESDPLAIVTF